VQFAAGLCVEDREGATDGGPGKGAAVRPQREPATACSAWAGEELTNELPRGRLQRLTRPSRPIPANSRPSGVNATASTSAPCQNRPAPSRARAPSGNSSATAADGAGDGGAGCGVCVRRTVRRPTPTATPAASTTPKAPSRPALDAGAIPSAMAATVPPTGRPAAAASAVLRVTPARAGGTTVFASATSALPTVRRRGSPRASPCATEQLAALVEPSPECAQTPAGRQAASSRVQPLGKHSSSGAW
jgi:hypothetical protein